MHANIEGALENLERSWRTFVHREKSLTKSQVEKVLKFGIKLGLKSTSELNLDDVDKIIDGRIKEHKGEYYSTKKFDGYKLRMFFQIYLTDQPERKPQVYTTNENHDEAVKYIYSMCIKKYGLKMTHFADYGYSTYEKDMNIEAFLDDFLA